MVGIFGPSRSTRPSGEREPPAALPRGWDTVSIVALELYREKLMPGFHHGGPARCPFLLGHRLQEKNYGTVRL